MQPISINTGRIKFILRPWQLSDLDSFVKYANNKKIADNLTDQFPHPITKEKGQKLLDYFISNNPLQHMAMVVNGEACGAIGIFPKSDIYRLNAELGYWVAEEYWGLGIATEAVKQMIIYGFNTWPINRIYATPFVTNIGSQKVLEKAGMVLEATIKDSLVKNGIIQDDLIYAIRRPV